MLKNMDVINKRVLESVGKENYDEYMLLTDGKEIDEILNSNNPVFEIYKYRDRILDKQNKVSIDKLKELLKNNDDIKLKESLEQIFMDYLSEGSFKIIKDILISHTNGWNISRLLDIHKKHKYNRIFSILTIKYEDWLKC